MTDINAIKITIHTHIDGGKRYIKKPTINDIAINNFNNQNLIPITDNGTVKKDLRNTIRDLLGIKKKSANYFGFGGKKTYRKTAKNNSKITKNKSFKNFA
jgi:hypothetical protein